MSKPGRFTSLFQHTIIPEKPPRMLKPLEVPLKKVQANFTKGDLWLRVISQLRKVICIIRPQTQSIPFPYSSENTSPGLRT